ncbi:MAG TPA: VWA domain-containing protein [Bryobacteraceae bacterium]|jgi:Ca-activated chloride channel family protein|nr:VWA domain-containing protein [Bryobacteraceae bacterium]
MRVLVCLFVGALCLESQQQPPAAAAKPAASQLAADATLPTQQPPTFVTGVQEVIVPVTVTDEKGKFVSDLVQSDFQILDQGKLQNIQYFSRERAQPVVVGILMDMSNNSRTHWKQYQDAAVELANTLLPGDKRYSGYLIGYGSEAELMVNTTIDGEKIMDRIRKIKPGGGSSLYDAIYLACTKRSLVQGEPVDPRRVVVVIGDGNDNSSGKTLDQVVELAQRNLVTIYGISTSAYGFEAAGDPALVRLAKETGGRVEYPLVNPYTDVSGYLSTPSDDGNYAYTVGSGGYTSAVASSIFKSVAHIAGEVTTQYILRYIPEVPAESVKQYRNIEVKVSLPNVTVRARKGYYPFTP